MPSQSSQGLGQAEQVEAKEAKPEKGGDAGETGSQAESQPVLKEMAGNVEKILKALADMEKAVHFMEARQDAFCNMGADIDKHASQFVQTAETAETRKAR